MPSPLSGLVPVRCGAGFALLVLILISGFKPVRADDLRTLAPGMCHRLEPVRASPGAGDRRAAIVIGNGAYRPSIGSLDNGPNDALAMTSTLRALGFEVTFGIDLSEKAVDDCLAGVRASAEPWDVVAFHYSGHGIQIDDENYLVGVDTAELTPKLVGLRPLQPIIDTLQAHATAVLVFLDACRNNPFAPTGQPGLSASTARSIRSATGATDAVSSRAAQARGLFVAYATSPNAVASDGTGKLSPFTEALVGGLSSAGWSIQRTLSRVTQKVGEATQWGQTPWSKSSLTNEVKLNGRMTLEETLALSEAWTRRSVDYLDRGLRDEAIAAAISGLPGNLDARNQSSYASAYLALYDALSTIRTQFPDADHSESNIFSPNRQYVTRSEGGRPYQVWDAKSKTLLFSLPPTGDTGGGKVEWAPDSASVAIVTGNGFVSVVRVPSGQVIAKFNGSMPKDRDFQKYAHVDSLSFDEDGKFILSAGGFIDPIKVFDVASGKLVRAFSQNELRQVVGKAGVGYIQAVYAKMLRGNLICAGFGSGSDNQNVAVALLSVSDKAHKVIHSFRDKSVNHLDCTQDATRIAINSYSGSSVEKLTVLSLAGDRVDAKVFPSYHGYFNDIGTHMAVWKNGNFQYMDLTNGDIVNRPGAPVGHTRKSWGIYSPSGISVGYCNQLKSRDLWSEIPGGTEMIDFALHIIPNTLKEELLTSRIVHPEGLVGALP